MNENNMVDLFHHCMGDESRNTGLQRAVKLVWFVLLFFQKAKKKMHYFRSPIKLILLIWTHKVMQLSLWN